MSEEAKYKDGDIARRAFRHLDMVSQLVWALMLKRVNQRAQYRGIKPYGQGLRAQARAQGFANQRDMQGYYARLEMERKQREGVAPNKENAKPIAVAVNEAFQ